MSDPLEQERKLMKVVKGAADALGLDLHRFAVVPNVGDNPTGTDYIELSLQVRPEAILTPEERERYEFTKMMEREMLSDLAKPDLTPQIEEATDEIKDLQRKAAEGWLEP